MLFRLFLLLTLVPIVELSILLEVHRGIANTWGTGTGLIVTFGAVIVSGLIGATLIRRQGLVIFGAVNAATARGEFPALALIDGALVLSGGVLLLTPGFLTDIVAFTLLVPWTRRLWRRAVVYWLRRKVDRGMATLRTPGARSTWPDSDRPDPADVIDVTPRDEASQRP